MQFISNFVPSALVPVLKKLVPAPLITYYIVKNWRRQEPADWPLGQHSDKQGIERYEYSLFSQNGEDGILRYLYSEIGFTSRLFFEFGFGVTQNNSLRLIMKENFGGVFVDGSEVSVRYFNNAACFLGLHNVRAIHRFLSLDNLESTIIESHLSEDIDLLSIDVDGNDYWFWEGIGSLSPRVVVIEYNASLGPDVSLTVPYDPSFDRHQKHASGFYHGASLTALQRLGSKKGYGLVGCNSNGVNAFFVKQDYLTENLTVLSPRSAYRPHRRRLERGFSAEDQFGIIKDLPYTSIE
jgi:hypothetical protein